jgi:hypothetical protein
MPTPSPGRLTSGRHLEGRSTVLGFGVVWTLVVVVVVAGCSGPKPGPDPASTEPSTSWSTTPYIPTPTPTAGGSANPTAHPTVDPTAVPADVPTTVTNPRGPNEKPPTPPLPPTGPDDTLNAVAFAEFFLKTIDWGGATTSSAYMRHYYEPTCEDCAAIATALNDARLRKYRNVGGRISFHGAHLSGRGGPAGANLHVSMVLDVAALEQFSHDGKLIGAATATNGASARLWLRWTGTRWTVVWFGSNK